MKYYFTFGGNHLDRYGNSLENCYAEIEGDNEESARERMVELRADKWCTSYLTPESCGIERYGLRRADPEHIDTREQRKEEIVESIVSAERERLTGRLKKLDEMKDIIRKLPVELIPKCREFNGQLDIDNLTREEAVRALSTLGAGRWRKDINNYNEGALDYYGRVDGVDVRLWAAGAPQSCRIVEYEEVIPEQTVIRKKLVCTE